MTPLQTQMFEAEEARKARAKQEKVQDAQGGGGRQRNSASGAGGPTASRKETVRYKNEGESSDDDALEVF